MSALLVTAILSGVFAAYYCVQELAEHMSARLVASAVLLLIWLSIPASIMASLSGSSLAGMSFFLLLLGMIARCHLRFRPRARRAGFVDPLTWFAAYSLIRQHDARRAQVVAGKRNVGVEDLEDLPPSLQRYPHRNLLLRLVLASLLTDSIVDLT